MKYITFLLTIVSSTFLRAQDTLIQNDVFVIPNGLLGTSGLDTQFVAKGALFVAITLLWTLFCGKLFKILFKIPVIAGQIVGGILLGPSFINIRGFSFFAAPLFLHDIKTGRIYELISSDLFVFFIVLLSSMLTVSYLLWIAGHETDVRDIVKVGMTAILAGFLGAILPVVFTAGVLYYGFSVAFNLVESISLGLIFAATSVSIPVAVLFSFNKMHLKSSKVTLGAAIIDDIVAVILLSFFFICLNSGTFGDVHCTMDACHTENIAGAIVWMLITLSMLFFAGFYIIPPLIKFLKRKHQSHLIASVANGVMLIYFASAELIGGLAGITGAYFAGLFHRMGDQRHHAEKVISPFVNAVLLPIFLGSIGMNVNIWVLSPIEWVIVLLLLCIAIFSKLIGCYIATGISNLVGKRKNRWSFLESYLFGSSMVARGEVGLVIATVVYGAEVITPSQYVIAVMVIVLTTIAAPILLAVGFHHWQLQEIAGKPQDFSLNIGLFNIVGTTQMFHIIVSKIEKSKVYKTSVHMSEGRKIINLEGQNLKVILCPEEGIVFRGNREKARKILNMVKESVLDEIERLTVK